MAPRRTRINHTSDEQGEAGGKDEAVHSGGGAALAIASAARAQDSKRAGFAVAGKNSLVTIPQGFCQPEDADKLMADTMAALDPLKARSRDARGEPCRRTLTRH